MKKIFALIASPVVLLLFVMNTEPEQTATDGTTPVVLTAAHSAESSDTEISKKKKTSEKGWYRVSESNASEPLISYALSLIGSPYSFGGTSSNGFDCSGFTSHVYKEFGVSISRSSTTQSQDGVPVEREEARPGDLVVFTGTNPGVREPGHVGIVISEPGDTISFVHSSSNGGVKISQVEGTGYDDRFLGIRRLL